MTTFGFVKFSLNLILTFFRDFAHHKQTFTVGATLNVAPFCIHRINFKLFEKKVHLAIPSEESILRARLSIFMPDEINV
ncbi:hypothetical protein BpHYR1_048813 [Brachionus plicatilis]|uniref:Uncharacterized protein n=1 Tax=Brachionus plicatilis TaxID=10195 RepID=A0A3M7PEN2_BRAPC|nr:hypothetical protein BpHYR1_048813 [Brachionus plicatilis]